jgi:hypothetical protein
MRQVDVCAALNAMAVAPDVQMLSLLTRTTVGHTARIRSRTQQAGAPSVLTSVDWQSLAEPRHVNGLRLVRLLQWLDSTHIARVRLPEVTDVRLVRGVRVLVLARPGDSR